MSRQCSGIKRDGGRCTHTATPGSAWCYAHDPHRAAERKRHASKAARAKGGGQEIKDVKREIRAVIAAVLSRRVDKADGAVAIQGYNALLRALALEEKVALEELAREVEEIKRGFGGAA